MDPQTILNNSDSSDDFFFLYEDQKLYNYQPE